MMGQRVLDQLQHLAIELGVGADHLEVDLLVQFVREVAHHARQLRPGVADGLHARLHDAFLQLRRHVVEALQGRCEIAVLLAAQDLQQLVAGQHQLADHGHQVFEQVDMHADGLRGNAGFLVGGGRVLGIGSGLLGGGHGRLQLSHNLFHGGGGSRDLGHRSCFDLGNDRFGLGRDRLDDGHNRLGLAGDRGEFDLGGLFGVRCRGRRHAAIGERVQAAGEIAIVARGLRFRLFKSVQQALDTIERFRGSG